MKNHLRRLQRQYDLVPPEAATGPLQEDDFPKRKPGRLDLLCSLPGQGPNIHRNPAGRPRSCRATEVFARSQPVDLRRLERCRLQKYQMTIQSRHHRKTPPTMIHQEVPLKNLLVPDPSRRRQRDPGLSEPLFPLHEFSSCEDASKATANHQLSIGGGVFSHHEGLGRQHLVSVADVSVKG